MAAVRTALCTEDYFGTLKMKGKDIGIMCKCPECKREYVGNVPSDATHVLVRCECGIEFGLPIKKRERIN